MSDEEEKQAAVPPPPELPAAPELKPNLPKRAHEDTPEAQQYRNMGVAYTIPTALIAPIVGLTVLGVWLDGRFHWAPIASIVGMLLGLVCGTINMVRLFKRLE